MPLLLVDLDNTPIDRAAAFSQCATAFAAARAAGKVDIDWLVAADRAGLERRERPPAMIAQRFRLSIWSVWLHRDRAWTTSAFKPSLIAGTVPEAVAGS